MESFVLTRWEATNLFIKIVAKYEGKSEQDIERELLKALFRYRRATVSAEVAMVVLKPIANRNGNENYYPNFLSDLSTEIRNGVPNPKSENRLLMMLEYINETDQIKKYRVIGAKDEKQESLQGSYWWMYTYEHYKDSDTREKRLVITRDSILLSHFGYVTLVGPKTHEGRLLGQQYYSGQYYIKNNKYLFLDVRINDTKDKEVRAVIDIGTGNISIGDVFTGHYLNAGNNLYFGPLLFERVDTQTELSGQVYQGDSEQLDDVVKSFFSRMEIIPYKITPTLGAKNRVKKFLDGS